ncbi:hypothetical protein ABPG77_004375 [Micractinium sp. CCAP 211/92]
MLASFGAGPGEPLAMTLVALLNSLDLPGTVGEALGGSSVYLAAVIQTGPNPFGYVIRRLTLKLRNSRYCGGCDVFVKLSSVGASLTPSLIGIYSDTFTLSVPSNAPSLVTVDVDWPVAANTNYGIYLSRPGNYEFGWSYVSSTTPPQSADVSAFGWGKVGSNVYDLFSRAGSGTNFPPSYQGNPFQIGIEGTIPPATAIPVASATATKPLNTTTVAITTPAQPLPTTTKPFTASSQPIPSSAQPIPTPTKSLPSSAKPLTASSQPLTASSQPLSTPSQPIPAPAKPLAPSAKPLTASTKPFSTAAQPLPATPPPLSASTKPFSTAAQPLSTATQPVAATSKPLPTATTAFPATASKPIPTTALTLTAATTLTITATPAQALTSVTAQAITAAPTQTLTAAPAPP